MSADFCIQSKTETLFCRLVENKNAVFTFFVVFRKIPAFGNFNSQKSQKIPRNWITLKINISAVQLSAPAHALFADNVAVSPRNILYRSVLHKFFADGFAACRNFVGCKSTQKVFLIEPEVFAEHVIVVFFDKRRADNQRNRCRKLKPDKNISQF